MTAAVEGHRVGGDAGPARVGRARGFLEPRHLWDESRAAFRDAPSSPLTPEGTRQAEGPIFTPLVANGEMAQALLALAVASGDARWRRLAAQLVQSLGAEAARSPAGAALALAAQQLDRDAPATT
jgi:uncharacterized protein YyaL (SSP411 family)